MIHRSNDQTPDYDRLVEMLVDRFGDDLRWVASFDADRYDYQIRYIRSDLTAELSSHDLDVVIHRSIGLFRRPYLEEVYAHLGHVRTLVLEQERATAVHIYLSESTGVIVKVKTGNELPVPSFTQDCLDAMFSDGKPVDVP